LSFADPLTQIEAIIILAAIALISLKFKLLDRGGIIASLPIGYVILTLASVQHFAILLTFFAVSGLVTKIRVKQIGEELVEKNWIRSWRNVIANGFAPMSIILVAELAPSWRSLLAVSGYLGAIGTAFADTLATEIGLLYPRDPRLITNFRRVKRGTPGAVSPYGYLGGTAAALITCGLAYAFKFQNQLLLLITFASSIIGMTVDSALGATIQAKYRCNVCGKLTESSHHCGKAAEKIAGIRMIDTHAVNLISTTIGALTAIALTITLA